RSLMRRARGLVVMMRLLQSRGRRFDSDRAHRRPGIVPVRVQLAAPRGVRVPSARTSGPKAAARRLQVKGQTDSLNTLVGIINNAEGSWFVPREPTARSKQGLKGWLSPRPAIVEIS